jgi:hypothetical protein
MQVLGMADEDVPIETILPDSLRMQLYERHIEQVLAGGEGTIDAAALTGPIPMQLKLDAAAAARRARDIAKGKARGCLVQALAYYRTRDFDAAVKYMNNLIACERLSGGLADALKWDAREELLDSFGLYCERNHEEERLREMGAVLGLSEAEQDRVREAVASGASSGERKEKAAEAGSGSIF